MSLFKLTFRTKFSFSLLIVSVLHQKRLNFWMAACIFIPYNILNVCYIKLILKIYVLIPLCDACRLN